MSTATSPSRKRNRQPSSQDELPIGESFHHDDGEEDEDDEDEDGGGKKNDKKSGRRKIKIEYINDKSRRHITFSKRKAGIMKKAYELSTLTGTQVLLLVVSETGLVYTFTTSKLQPLVTQPEGKNLIQTCLNAPAPPTSASAPSNPAAPSGTGPGADSVGTASGPGITSPNMSRSRVAQSPEEEDADEPEPKRPRRGTGASISSARQASNAGLVSDARAPRPSLSPQSPQLPHPASSVGGNTAAPDMPLPYGSSSNPSAGAGQGGQAVHSPELSSHSIYSAHQAQQAQSHGLISSYQPQHHQASQSQHTLPSHSIYSQSHGSQDHHHSQTMPHHHQPQYGAPQQQQQPQQHHSHQPQQQHASTNWYQPPPQRR